MGKIAEHCEDDDNRSARQERIYSLASKIFVWGLFFGTLYLLRSFFLLIFLTFVFSYIQSHGVHKLQPYVKKRTLSVVMVGVVFLAILVAVGWFVIPQVVDQAKIFADRYPVYFQALDDKVEELAKLYPVLEPVIEGNDTTAEKSVSLSLIQHLLGFESQDSSGGNLTQVVDLLRNISKPLLAIGSAFLLSLLFSFLIILDLPRLRQSIAGLAETKLGFIYEEVAGSIRDFAEVLGRAFEAQLLIAIVNTVLTAGVIYVLGLQKSLAFLSLIVFFCSFVPVAGVFISSIPICLMAGQSMGFKGILLAAGLIWVIHMIEAYVLNPRIFGDKLKINPVLVLIILTVAGKLFHVWGLLLSLPIYTYVFGHAIQEKEED